MHHNMYSPFTSFNGLFHSQLLYKTNQTLTTRITNNELNAEKKSYAREIFNKKK